MSDLLVAMILALCPGYDTDSKGQAITNQCQESLTNCAVGKHGKIDEKTIQKCLKEYEDEQGKRNTNTGS